MDRVFDRFIDSPDPPASPIENEGMAWLEPDDYLVVVAWVSATPRT
jgi:hypothetical protein